VVTGKPTELLKAVAELYLQAENLKNEPGSLTEQQQVFGEGLAARIDNGEDISELMASSGLEKTVYHVTDDITHTVYKAKDIPASTTQHDELPVARPCGFVCRRWYCYFGCW